MNRAFVVLSIVSVAISLVVRTGNAIADDHPNIVPLLADDLGYGDLSCFGSAAVKTPHLDRLANEGMKWKLLALDGKPVELFDLQADPNEQRNVIDDHPDLVASLTAQLKKWLNASRTTK